VVVIYANFKPQVIVQFFKNLCIYKNVRCKCLVLKEFHVVDNHGVTYKKMLDSACYVILVDTQYREPVVS
jgi:hypothetical protein